MSNILKCDGIPSRASELECRRTTDPDRVGHGWLQVNDISNLPGQNPKHFCSWACLSGKAYCMTSGDNCK